MLRHRLRYQALRLLPLLKTFILESDHRNLLWIESSVVPKIVRWKLFLQGFVFWLKHIPGKLNVTADCLSRLGVPADAPEEPAVEELATEDLALETLAADESAPEVLPPLCSITSWEPTNVEDRDRVPENPATTTTTPGMPPLVDFAPRRPTVQPAPSWIQIMPPLPIVRVNNDTPGSLTIETRPRRRTQRPSPPATAVVAGDFKTDVGKADVYSLSGTMQRAALSHSSSPSDVALPTYVKSTRAGTRLDYQLLGGPAVALSCEVVDDYTRTTTGHAPLLDGTP